MRIALILMTAALIGSWSVAGYRLVQFHSYEVASARV